MMAIGSVTGANNSMQAGYSGRNMQTDSVSKNIQNQIANAQKQLQELSSNGDMTLEEKMKKRQEIQQEITTLNQQLRQHQMEQRKEQQSKGASMDDLLGGKQSARAEKPENGLSQTSMQAMISADSSMKQAQIQGNVATRMKGRAGILKTEIQQDAGGNTEAKEAELAEIEQKAMNATASQMNTLASVKQAVEEAAKAEQGNKSNAEDTKTESRRNGTETTGEASENTADNKSAEATVQMPETPVAAENTMADAAGATPQAMTYIPIDILL